MKQRAWEPRLTTEAAKDLVEIVRWTRAHFGGEQARTYRATIYAALRVLELGPKHPSVRSRDSILSGLKTLHVARAGRRGSNVLVFRVESTEQRKIQVLRILHESMDLARHLSPRE